MSRSILTYLWKDMSLMFMSVTYIEDLLKFLILISSWKFMKPNWIQLLYLRTLLIFTLDVVFKLYYLGHNYCHWCTHRGKGYAIKCLIYWMCMFDGFCFCPHIHCWLMFEVKMRLMVLSLDVKYTDSCDTVCQLLQWVDAFPDVVLFKEPCCSQNARVSQHNCVNVCLCVDIDVCVYFGAFTDLSPSGKCVLSYWDKLWDPTTLEQNTVLYSSIIERIYKYKKW